MSSQETHPMILNLEARRDQRDRACLARLRRGLGKREGTAEMFPYVVPYIPRETSKPEPYFVVASLFGLHPEPPTQPGASLGAVFAAMRPGDSTERRFTALLNAHYDEVADHLRHAVSLARSQGIGIDFHVLLRDLLRWNDPERRVQLRWARDYWRSSADEQTGNESPSRETAR